MQATQVGRLQSAWWSIVAVALQFFRSANKLSNEPPAKLKAAVSAASLRATLTQKSLSALQPMLGRYVKVLSLLLLLLLLSALLLLLCS